MRKIFYFAALLLAMTSCSGWFDTEPVDNTASENTFTQEAAYRDYMNSIYAMLASEDLYGGQITFSTEFMGQTLDVASNSTYADLALGKFELAENKKLSDDVYAKLYRAIYGCNDILRLFELNPEVSFVPGSKQMMMAEAKALRAYLHIELVRLFAETPASSTAGVTSLTWSSKVGVQGEMMTADELLNKAVAELDEAIEQLKIYDPAVTGEDYNNNSLLGASAVERVWKLNYYAALTIKARALLTLDAEYGEALEALQEVITSEKYDFISVVSGSDYGFSSEYIFGLPSRGLSFGELCEDVYVNQGITVSEAVSQDDLYADDRRLWWFDDNNTLYAKFDKDNLIANWDISPAIPVVKLGEVYLMAVEAAIKSDNLAEAIALYNEFIVGRNSPSLKLDASASKVDVVTALDKQFTYEFLGEGVRFHYLKRNCATVDAFDGSSIKLDCQTLGGYIEQ